MRVPKDKCPLDTELISAVARELDIPHNKAKKVLRAILQIMVDKLTTLGALRLRGLGTFSTVTRKKHRHFNPQTGLTEVKALSKVIRFKPARKIRDAINKRTVDSMRKDKGLA